VAGDPVGLGDTDQASDVYGRLIRDLDAAGARYRLIEHPPEGRTELVSALRGHDVAHAAKCLIVMVKIGKKQTRYVLAVVPGDARLDLAAVKALFGGSYVAFAATDKAEQLAGSVSGTVLPAVEPRSASNSSASSVDVATVTRESSVVSVRLRTRTCCCG